MKGELVWSLVIATYNRPSILERCIRLAAEQTRPPVQIVIVDASDGWEVSKKNICDFLENKYPSIDLIYEGAIIPSLTAQRNQGIGLAIGDIVFLIDDDSLMYSDCADKILQVYEADVNHTIQGVSAINVARAPDEVMHPNLARYRNQTATRSKQTVLRRFFKAIFRTEDTYFLPYEMPPPHHNLDPLLKSLNIGRISVMAGYAMTFRRDIFSKERFCEVLLRYAAGEDQDLSYRVSRHGALVNAVDAKLCHLEVAAARPSRYQISAMASLNPAVLHKIYAKDLVRLNKQWKRIVRKRLLINFIKDIAEREWKFSRTRGVMFAIRNLPEVNARSGVDLQIWYRGLQQKIYLSTRNT